MAPSPLDLGRQLNDAMFPFNGESTGYVLKSRQEPGNKKLELVVISGYHLHPPEDLRYSNGDFTTAVSVELITNDAQIETNGSPTKTSSKRSWFKRQSSNSEVRDVFKTAGVHNNGFNPVWNATWTRDIKGSELAFSFIRFGVFTEEGEFCSRTVRVVDLNQGKEIFLLLGYYTRIFFFVYVFFLLFRQEC